ncbi:MAG TPA: zf-HC2 domain-containing protein [Polyangiaceae bacterium]|nr:zf-HC2 domain-containing protein [Polyangiaceae bacterium]
MSHCREAAALLEPYADGELSPDKIVEVEQHLEGCERCSARVSLDAAFKRSVQKTVREAAPVSSAFMARLGAALEAERERETELIESAPPPRMLPWRVTASLAAAAALVLVWGATQKNGGNDSARLPAQPPTTDMNMNVNVDQFIDDLVTYHLQPQQPDVTEPAKLEQFDPEVGVPVRLPRLTEYGARWEGASVVPIRNRRAALLRYHVGGHKMTLYVYDAARVPMERRLKARVVRNEPVYVGWERGFTIAATERRGVGYATVATDMNDQESAEIVASLHTP